MAINQTYVGNLINEVEPRTSKAGKPWVTFRIAFSKRVKDQNGQWTDGDSTFLNCRAFGDLATNIAATLQKGMRVIVVGELFSRNFTDKNGQERSSLELDVEAIGPELRFATANVTRAGRKQAPQQAQQAPQQANTGWGGQNDAPWGSAPQNAGFDTSTF